MPDTTNDLPSTDQAADDIFLSPRVIDMKSFEDLEGRLRKVINHALETGKALVTLDEQSRDSMTVLKDAGPELDERSQAAAALLSTLDKRVSDAEALLGRAIERAERAERFEGDVADTIARGEQAIQLRLDAMVAEAEERLRAAQTASTARITELTTKLKQTIDNGVEEARREAENVRTRMVETSRQAEQTALDLERRLATLRDEAQDLRTPVLEMLNDLCTRAGALLGVDPKTPDAGTDPAVGSMGDLVNRAEALRDETETAIRRLEHIKTQTDQARSLLGQSLLESAEIIDGLGEKQGALHARLKESADLCDAAEAAMGTRMQELRDVIDLPLKQADIEARRLANLVDQADASAKDAAEALAKHHQTLAAIDQAVGRLEPWRGALLEGKDDLPTPLKSVIDRFRAEIGQDVGRIADGLHAIARRAEGVESHVRTGRRPLDQ